MSVFYGDAAPIRHEVVLRVDSWGVAYKGFERALIDLDRRYLDYADAGLFGQSVRDGGLGWKSVFAVAPGNSYDLTDRLTLRGGYLYNTNPIPAPATLFNVQLPGIIRRQADATGPAPRGPGPATANGSGLAAPGTAHPPPVMPPATPEA
jgi:hypothetical protein